MNNIKDTYQTLLRFVPYQVLHSLFDKDGKVLEVNPHLIDENGRMKIVSNMHYIPCIIRNRGILYLLLVNFEQEELDIICCKKLLNQPHVHSKMGHLVITYHIENETRKVLYGSFKL